jgi:nucleoside-diphosphate-sugar epimerase
VAVIVTPFDPSRGFASDSQLTINMINSAVAAGVKRIVYVGSWTVHQPERVSGIAQRFIPTEECVRVSTAAPPRPL